MSTQDKSIIQSIEKIPQILNLFMEHTLLTLHDIHVHSGFTKTSASRMCNSLVNIGYLEKVYIGQTPYYRLGIELYRLGLHSIETIDIQASARKYLTLISNELGDNTYLFIIRNEKALCIERVKGSYHIQTNTTSVGDLLPLNRGGGPLALLSHMNEESRSSIVNSLQLSEDEETVLHQKMTDIKNSGFAVSIGQVFPGTGAIGVPVFDVTNSVVGAISVGGVIERFSKERIELIENTLKKYSLELSKELGYQQ